MSQEADKDFPTPPTYSQTVSHSGHWTTIVTKTHYSDGSTKQIISTISKK